jgi:hypothetical protein
MKKVQSLPLVQSVEGGWRYLVVSCLRCRRGLLYGAEDAVPFRKIFSSSRNRRMAGLP